MKTKHLLIAALMFGMAFRASGEPEESCFIAGFLQGERTVLLQTEGNKISGTFSVQNSDDSEAVDGVATYKFTGTRSGDTLKVRFEGDKLPNVGPSEMKGLNWKIATVGGEEVVRIKFTGKNYDTNEYEDYVADFESCEPGYGRMVKTAKRLAKVGTKGEGKQAVNFTADDKYKAFLIKVPKGKSFGIDAPGLLIQFYYPNKKPDPEGGIDAFGTKQLTDGGDCLLVLKRALPAGKEPEPASFDLEYSVTDEQ